MKLVIVFVLALIGCDPASTPTPDAGADARRRSFDQPLDAICSADEAPLCAGGLGACTDSICRPWCKAVGGPPRCAAGEIEHMFLSQGYELCVCVPA